MPTSTGRASSTIGVLPGYTDVHLRGGDLAKLILQHRVLLNSARAEPRARGRVSEHLRSRFSAWGRSLSYLDPRVSLIAYFKCIALTSNAEQAFLPGDETRAQVIDFVSRFGWADRQLNSIFSVFRPTSLHAIRSMMTRQATGKGLNVKGKSSQNGLLSGFVPFLQIHEEAHKKKCGTPSRSARIRVYYKSANLRAGASAHLQGLCDEMAEAAKKAFASVSELAQRRKTSRTPPAFPPTTRAEGARETSSDASDEAMKLALSKTLWLMDDPAIYLLDQHAAMELWGLDVPERLFWEAYVVRADISRERPEWKTGRPSMPDFMDMTMKSAREWTPESQQPRIVVLQWDAGRPMNSRSLLTAYEEDQKVLPVVSDMDPFLIGSQQVTFQPLEPSQVKLLSWCVKHIESLLADPKPVHWTNRWLEVLKSEAKNGFHAHIPEFGLGDSTTTDVMRGASTAVKHTGAVRHGAECFNYYFPQPLDDHYLVMWTGFQKFPNTREWVYLSEAGLRAFLLDRVREGFAFPLNPKWVLADPGWFEIFEELHKRPESVRTIKAWLPPGLTEQILEIGRRFPGGFQPLPGAVEDMDDAQAELAMSRHMTRQRIKTRLRAMHGFRKG